MLLVLLLSVATSAYARTWSNHHHNDNNNNNNLNQTQTVASFTATPTSGNAPLTVTFTDTSKGSPTYWSWNFGDGGTSAAQNPTHTYTQAGTYTVSLTATNSAGSNTATKSITVINPVSSPVASFSAAPTSGNTPLTVTFTDTSTGSPTYWSWNFGDGGTSASQNPTHTYTQAGTYTVSLTATNSAGSNTATKSSSISVSNPVSIPVASFSAAPTSGNTPLTVTFTDTSTGSPTYWAWNFGDGGTSAAQNPTHTYTQAGTYTVSLTAANSAGSNTATKSGYISVTNPVSSPVASFTTTPTSGNAPLTVTFADASTGSPTAWAWSFGDGGTSAVQSPTYTYSVAGTYTPSLTVSNAYGSNTLVSSTPITVSSTTPIVADFSSNIVLGKVPLSVQFTDTSTGGPTTWSWDFGDGTNSTLQSPTHTYQAIGTYTVTLRAGVGTSLSTATKTNYITVGNGLQAAFSASPGQGVAPLTVQFTDASIGTPTAWLWDFGDGTTSTLQSPGHTYSLVGNYSVRLTASSGTDSNTSSPVLINVASTVFSGTSVVDFNSNITSGNTPLTVQFYDLCTWNPEAWEWDFNSDGVVDSNEKNPVCVFLNPGTYTVTMKAGNSTAWGNITKSNYITVGEGLKAGFTASPTSGDVPLTVQFNDTSTGSVSSWLWDFGDGNTSTSQNSSHTYYASGTYSVTLNASNATESSALTVPGYIIVGSSSESAGGGTGSTSSIGGSLAGAGGSPEPTSNIEVKIQTQRYVGSGSHVRFEFTNDSTCIDYIEFDSNKNFGKTTTAIEQLKGKSVLTPTEPGGTVYKYLNIWVGNPGISIPGNIDNATIGFRVSKNNLTTNQNGESTITLQRYSYGMWNPLNTTKIGEDGQSILFEAKTPGFSPFAITSGNLAPTNENMSQLQANSNQTEFEKIRPAVENKESNNPDTNTTANTRDWSKFSGIIKFLVVVMVGIFIALAVREKIN
jgi:PGF-pre-PGF domain-containing protein